MLFLLFMLWNFFWDCNYNINCIFYFHIYHSSKYVKLINSLRGTIPFSLKNENLKNEIFFQKSVKYKIINHSTTFNCLISFLSVHLGITIALINFVSKCVWGGIIFLLLLLLLCVFFHLFILKLVLLKFGHITYKYLGLAGILRDETTEDRLRLTKLTFLQI